MVNVCSYSLSGSMETAFHSFVPFNLKLVKFVFSPLFRSNFGPFPFKESPSDSLGIIFYNENTDKAI